MSRTLLKSRKFAPLFWCQFFSAFNDSYLKTAIVFLILYPTELAHSGPLIQLAGALFIAPSFFLSALGGELADRFDKAIIARRLKLAEFGAVAIACGGFFFHSMPVLFVALTLFGILSATFGPVKYGILPDHLSVHDLPAGNALVEGATFIAIIAGTFVAALAEKYGGSPATFAGLTLGFALLSWLFAAAIPRSGEGAPNLHIDRNVLRSTLHLIGDLRADKRLWHGGIFVSLFWLVGAIVFGLLPPIVKVTLGGGELVVSVYLALFAIGIAVGSGLASWLVDGRTLTLPTPIAGVLIGIFSLDLAWTLHGVPPHQGMLDVAEFFKDPRAWHVGADLALLAMGGGLFVVPSFAAVQAWAPADHRARIVAAVNVLSALLMVAGSLSVAGLQAMGWTMPMVFVALGLGALAVSVWIFCVLPTNPLRDFAALVFRVVYRLEVEGIDNVAKAGPNAIIALNHVSLLDAEIAFSILDNNPVFAIDHQFAQKWWMKPVVKFMHALPLDPTRPLATRQLINEVKAGSTLVIFPEGRLTRTGSLMKVYDGPGLIADKAGVPVVPVRIEGAEKSRFSYLTGAQVNRGLFPRIKVTVLEPQRVVVPDHLKGRGRRQAAGAALYDIMSDMVFRTTSTDRTIWQATVDAALEHGPKHVALEDPVAGPMTYKRALIGARVLGAKLMPLAPAGGKIGVMLPTSVGCVVTLLGLMSAGRIVAMVNFSAGAAAIKSAGKAAQFDTIVTSRAFVEKGKLDKLVADIGQVFKLVYLEDVRATVTTPEKLLGALKWKTPLVRPKGPFGGADEPAAVLFTSGSEGKPKGVVLSHRNMLSNAAQARSMIDFGREDIVFNALPMFHALGLTDGMIVPLVFGVKGYLYPSPLHYRIIPELIYGSNATILFGTDTFLAGYARAANPYDFRSLRYIVAGAEPIKDSTRQVYQEKFGVRILEGYGITEMAPVLSCNTPMFNKNGTVGRLWPGMKMRLEPVEGIEDGGKLVVSGPNTMLGYLKDDQPGVLQPPPDGWHDTGDIVSVDDKGFITIKGRAKRFAKIAGEMVSLAAIENLAAHLWPDEISAAAAVPDQRKGERVILLTRHKGATRADFATFAKLRGAADVMVPADVRVVDEIPLLGSGKLDFAAVKRLVEEQEEERASAA
ncbi:Acyl-[ACP]--phospholipid O-acyltransferase [Beijerinckiaceae bacterium RH AL1]|nr:acyl-[ACP]--phospholipid O-acyltransferase [Beijerinckiaceae bacterium]VVB47182.1 Acyl-[ACP]--phospholipid O-acyltransferase [Beijerinckiaceae bacterium RH CH11]VVB47265.1 Acyl-[ACP]--phospholipid O-acyltransferase [Beijerinckiaceae bacterium RH AL8]VVC55756.1 Acyl-[ACP]--phospholipid O-acyltransferase [Beijerinckiaceae bacterium RH AL1]